MQINRNLTLYVALFHLTLFKSNLLAYAQMSTTSASVCKSKKLEELDECWNTLPNKNNDGISTDSQSMDNTCRLFNAGMRCVENWKNSCLQAKEQQQVDGSIIGAVETYKVLCSNTTFREKFLQHAHCYNRISKHWDDCTRKFSNTLKRDDHARDVRSLCCVRLRYLQCIKNVASSFCTKNAAIFLEELANSLMQSTLPNYHSSRCDNFEQESCMSSPGWSCTGTSWLWIFAYFCSCTMFKCIG